MKTLALISQKGGVGKTTLAAHLAVHASMNPVPAAAGERRAASPHAVTGTSPQKKAARASAVPAKAPSVALIDADPQGSLSAWWNRREAPEPQFIQVSLERLEAQLAKLAAAGDVDLVVIDTPPALGETIIQVGRIADLILIPVRPSPHDLHAVGATVDLVENLGRPLAFVVNGATARTRIAAEAAVALSQHGRVAPVTMHHRTDFASSMTDGRTVMELTAEGRSALEVGELWKYVNTLLVKGAAKSSRAAA